MDTIVTLAIIAGLVLLVFLVVLPRMWRRTAARRHERELGRRRDAAVDIHRRAAHDDAMEAQRLETRAERAAREARTRRERSAAHGKHAEAHARGLADDELLDRDGSVVEERTLRERERR